MLNNVSINTKLFGIILIELIISSLILATFAVSTIKEMSKENIKKYEDKIIEDKKEKIKEHVDMAKGVLNLYLSKHTENTTQEELKQIQNDALKLLRSMNYGDNDGYIFVWTYDGVPLALNPRPELIGQKLLDLKGGEGKEVIKDHIANAKKGGGHYYTYKWKTTSQSPYQTKISYSYGIDKWGWFVGTGEYLEKEEKHINQARETIQQHADDLVKQIIINASILVIITSTILFFIIRKIIFRPLGKLSTGLNDFFKFIQNKSKKVEPIEVSSNDEIGIMAKEINESIKISSKSHEVLQQLNEALQNEKERFELAVEGAANGIFDWNLKDGTVYYSPRWKSIIGYEDNEIENAFEQWEKRVHKDDLEKTKKLVQDYLEGKTQIFNAVHRMQHKDGHWVWIDARAKVSRDKEGNPLRMVGFHADITELVDYRQSLEKKVLEKTKKLRERNKSFELFLDTTMEAVVITDMNNQIILANQACATLFQVPNKEAFLERDMTDFVPDYEIPKLQKALQQEYDEPQDYDLKKLNGEIFPALASGRYIKLDGQKVRISCIIDLTKIKEKEKLFYEQSKLASMGEMIGNIAHQWRQPLSLISTSASGILVQKEYGIMSDELLKESCDNINNNVQYLSKTIDDFRNFIKGDRKRVIFSLSDDINSFITLVKGAIKNNEIQMHLDIQDNIEINGYPNELIQCLINIFNNAKDALKEKNLEEKHIFINTLTNEKEAIIEIYDNAGGIPKNILPNIFEPYFTTKHQSQGTGLGLSMSHRLIVEGMHGSVRATNKKFVYDDIEYKGALFKITIPL